MTSASRERTRKSVRSSAGTSDQTMDEFEIFRRQSLHGGRAAIKGLQAPAGADAETFDPVITATTSDDRKDKSAAEKDSVARKQGLSVDASRRDLTVPENDRKSNLSKSPLGSKKSADRSASLAGRIAEVDSPSLSPSRSHPATPLLNENLLVQMRIDDIKICHLNSVLKDNWMTTTTTLTTEQYLGSKSRTTSYGKRPGSTKSSGNTRNGKTATAAATYYVQVLGSAGVGKSTLCSQFGGGDLDGDNETMDNDVDNETEQDSEFCRPKRISVLLDGEESTLVFLHAETQNNLDQLSIVSGVHAYLVVYAIDDLISFRFARAILQTILVNNDMKTAVVLVANKNDLARCKEVRTEDGKSLAAQYSSILVETSATLQHHVEDLLLETLRQIRASIAKQTQFALQSASDYLPSTPDALNSSDSQKDHDKHGIFCSIIRKISKRK